MRLETSLNLYSFSTTYHKSPYSIDYIRNRTLHFGSTVDQTQGSRPRMTQPQGCIGSMRAFNLPTVTEALFSLLQIQIILVQLDKVRCSCHNRKCLPQAEFQEFDMTGHDRSFPGRPFTSSNLFHRVTVNKDQGRITFMEQSFDCKLPIILFKGNRISINSVKKRCEEIFLSNPAFP